ncbi:MAG: S-layer homology domain-containing protein, partial [Peptococcaceae bacterium]|nr:S-layer homology domain-containing protein [Peptococcaceae bacterium]
NLERSYGTPGGRVWNIQFANSNNARIWASVDAKTGQLLSFYKDYQINSSSEGKKKLRQDEAQKIAAKFIERMQPKKSNQIILRQAYPDTILQAKIIPYPSDNYNFQYSRIVNGIVYPENGFNISVSASSKEVLSYNLTWLDSKFPDSAEVVGVAEINKKYLLEYPLKLEYSREYAFYGSQDQRDYILLYQSQGGEGVLFDGVSGLQIDYMGNEVTKKNKDYFNDIKNHPAAEDIKLLAQEGIVVGTGGEYRPNDYATVAEVLAMLDKAYGNRYYFPLTGEKDPWYEQVIENARSKGILDKDFVVDPEAAVNRIELSRMGANAEGWGDLARVSEIFRLDFSDAKKISYENRGYAAAMIGLKLMSLENGDFNPQNKITRGELATFLVKLLK